MFKITESTDLSQISLTGIRAIVIIGLLSVLPRSFEEIKEALLRYKLINENTSDDTIRVDLATIKDFGCEISRPSSQNNNKYVLEKHPFAMNITEEEIKIVKKAYNAIKDVSNIFLLIEYDDLFKKLAEYIQDQDIKEQILGISIFKRFNVDIIKDLILDCQHRRLISIVYNSPKTLKEKVCDGVAQNLFYRNDKIYLNLSNNEKDKIITYNVNRIKKISYREFVKNERKTNNYKVLFYLKNYSSEEILDNEKVIECNERGFLVEGNYLNSFWAAQRILSFASRCTVVEPLEFKTIIIRKLEGIKNIYEQ